MILAIEYSNNSSSLSIATSPAVGYSKLTQGQQAAGMTCNAFGDNSHSACFSIQGCQVELAGAMSMIASQQQLHRSSKCQQVIEYDICDVHLLMMCKCTSTWEFASDLHPDLQSGMYDGLVCCGLPFSCECQMPPPSANSCYEHTAQETQWQVVTLMLSCRQTGTDRVS